MGNLPAFFLRLGSSHGSSAAPEAEAEACPGPSCAHPRSGISFLASGCVSGADVVLLGAASEAASALAHYRLV